MNPRILNMILKLKEWEEELEKQKFTIILSERRKIETYMRELEERFTCVFYNSDKKEKTSQALVSIYTEIQYITEQLMEIKKIVDALNQEVEKQRQAYEDAFKERKKIEQLHEKLTVSIRTQREKLEEKLISEIFISRIRK